MSSKKRVFVPAFAALAMLGSLLCLAAPPVAAAQRPQAIAQVAVTADLATFQPLISFAEVRVTVSGPGGFVVVETFAAGEVPTVQLPGTDGLYKYELRFSPVLDEADRQLLAAARESGIDLGDEQQAEASRVQSGSFSLAGGSPVPADLIEDTANVVLTNGDGVIRNSLCVGFDCPDAPVFSDSTILMMENNTRIKFGDTSNSPFPRNDWEIEANSSLSGGASYLGFNDCGSADNDGGCATDLVFAVESGARSSALYVESDGDVGIGTSNPVLDLHIVTGNTPALRLDQDGSSGFAPQVWDIAGNETSFFIRDVTGGSQLPFRIRPGAPNSAIDINGTGDVGVGTSSPTAPVHVQRNGSSANAAFLLTNTGGTNPQSWFFQNQSANGAFVVTPNTSGTNAPLKVFPGAPENSIVVGQNGGGSSPRVGIHKVSGLSFPLEVGTDATNGNGAHVTAAGIWTDGSSRVNKTNIVDLQYADALAAVTGLQPVRYVGKNDDSGEEYLGFIAEDVPELLAMNHRTGLSPMDIVAALTKVVQEQQAVIDAQRADNAQLAARLARLEAAIEALGK